MLLFDEIERRRELNRIRKSELAERAGIHKSTYSKWLKPMPLGPSAHKLERLETALNEIIAELPATRRQS